MLSYILGSIKQIQIFGLPLAIFYPARNTDNRNGSGDAGGENR
jgi:hypothetical protein